MSKRSPKFIAWTVALNMLLPAGAALAQKTEAKAAAPANFSAETYNEFASGVYNAKAAEEARLAIYEVQPNYGVTNPRTPQETREIFSKTDKVEAMREKLDSGESFFVLIKGSREGQAKQRVQGKIMVGDHNEIAIQLKKMSDAQWRALQDHGAIIRIDPETPSRGQAIRNSKQVTEALRR